MEKCLCQQALRSLQPVFTTSECVTLRFPPCFRGALEASTTAFPSLGHLQERRPDAFGGVCRVGAGVPTAGRLKESQQARGRRRREGWLSQPCWQQAPRLRGNILFHSRQPLADWFLLRWRVQGHYEIRTMPVILNSYVFELSKSLLRWSRFC